MWRFFLCLFWVAAGLRELQHLDDSQALPKNEDCYYGGEGARCKLKTYSGTVWGKCKCPGKWNGWKNRMSLKEASKYPSIGGKVRMYGSCKVDVVCQRR